MAFRARNVFGSFEKRTPGRKVNPLLNALTRYMDTLGTGVGTRTTEQGKCSIKQWIITQIQFKLEVLLLDGVEAKVKCS